jgi:hypothetical protein
MNDHQNNIKCPNCNFPIDVEEIIKHQIEEKLEKEHREKYHKDALIIQQEKERMLKEKQEFEAFKTNEKEIFFKRLESEKNKIAEEEFKKAKLQSEQILLEMNKKLEESQKSNILLQQKELELQNQMNMQRMQLELEMKKSLLEEQQQIAEKIRKEEQEKIQIEKKEWERKFNDQKNLLDEMQRKANLGSQQSQGEAMEIVLEESLRRAFPYDEIIEVHKGMKGADVIQIIRNNQLQNCGSIVYESKNTQNWSKEWLEKLKKDKSSQGADVAVLVTTVYPAKMTTFGMVDGIWVCSLSDVIGLTTALRMQIIQLKEIKTAQENKGEKSTMLYDYLHSPAFATAVENIVLSYRKMKEDIDREKASLNKIWKQREMQLEKVIESTVTMYASIKGIGGAELPSVSYLELDEPIDE